MGNLMKILLFRKELDLACYLSAFYEVQLDLAMYIDAIKFDHFKLLNYLWVFNKNYIGSK